MQVTRKPTEVLSTIFGYSSFRPGQEEIIEHVLAGSDALVIMPTGGGKSICFQVPALCFTGLTLVVSPLIALMQDQVAALQELGVKADTMNSGTSAESRRQILSSIADGSLKMLYMAPESLMQEEFVNYLSGMQISLIAVDEAHCISVWGNDFRPEYTKLSYFKNRFPEIPMIALTATADAATQSDILSQLGLDGARRFLSSFERKNLTIRAAPGQDRWGQILRF